MQYPFECELCHTIIEDSDDRTFWHGYGNCVEITDEMWAQWKKEATGEVTEMTDRRNLHIVLDLTHLAYSIIHGTFDRESPGGCSCDLCKSLLNTIDALQKEESAKFYDEHYPPPGGLL